MTVECDDADRGVTQEATQCKVKAGESPSMAVVRAVAAASGRSAITAGDGTDVLDPLAETIDPEALNRIFGSRGGTSEHPALVEFQYGGHQVAVKGADSVCVTVE